MHNVLHGGGRFTLTNRFGEQTDKRVLGGDNSWGKLIMDKSLPFCLPNPSFEIVGYTD
jgi:hypothetical protein